MCIIFMVMEILFIESYGGLYVIGLRRVLDRVFGITIGYRYNNKFNIFLDGWLCTDKGYIFGEEFRVDYKNIPEDVRESFNKYVSDPFFELDFERFINEN